MSTVIALALVLAGLAGIGFGLGLGWFAWLLGEWERDGAWPVQLALLAFALFFVIAGGAAIRAAFSPEPQEPSDLPRPPSG